MIIKKLVVGPVMTNCYIISDESTRYGCVIDPGDDGELIMDVIIKNQLDIKYIILTHTHFDHICAVDFIKKNTGALIAVHKADSTGLTNPKINLGSLMNTNTIQPSADILLQDGDTINFGSIDFLVIHTPGHTVGGICLYSDGVLFSGDTLFKANIGRCDLPGGNLGTLILSINTKLVCLPDDVQVFPGHGPSTTIGYEKANNGYINY